MKRCPNCNAEIDADAKFCTSCGAKLAAPQQNNNANGSSAQPQQRINSQDLQNSLKEYWSWLVASWKKPSANQVTNKYFGLITLFLEALLFSVGVGHIVQKGASTATDTANNIASIFSNSSYYASYSVGFGFYVSFILIIFIAAIAMVGVAFLMLRVAGGNQEQESFLDYANRIAHYSSSILVLDLIFCLISFLSAVGSSSILISMLLLSLVSLIWIISLICGITTFKNGGQLDRIYSAVVANIIFSIIEAVAFSLVISKLGDTVSSLFQSLF